MTEPGDCDFELGTCLWGNEDGDDFDWTRHTGKTSSSGTGPLTDHSGTGKSGGGGGNPNSLNLFLSVICSKANWSV